MVESPKNLNWIKDQVDNHLRSYIFSGGKRHEHLDTALIFISRYGLHDSYRGIVREISGMDI